MKKIKVIGLQRSGTTYLEHIIDLNFECNISKEGDRSICWKHALPMERVKLPDDSIAVTIEEIKRQDVYIIVVSKSFDSWVKSLQKFPADLFQKRPSLKNDGDWRSGENLNLPELAHFYDKFHKKWEEKLIEHNINFHFVDYVNLLKAPEQELDRVNAIGVERKLKNYVTEIKVPQSQDFNAARKQEYLKQ